MCSKWFRILLTTASVGICISGDRIEQGDRCTLKNGDLGICTLFGNCISAKAMVKKGERPALCSFRQRTPVVCCEDVKTTTVYVPGKSKQMCKKYASSVFYELTLPSLVAEPEPVTMDSCAMSGLELISGGEQSLQKEFPHMAALGYDDENNKTEWKCGGSLISERYVLTAAHCIEDPTDRENVKWVLLGALNYNEFSTNVILLKIIDWIHHPDYYPPAHNDIALLKLEKDVVFTPFVRPACLHTLGTSLRQRVFASGWGTLGRDTNLSPHLMKAGLRVAESSKCNVAFGKRTRKFEENIMICAGDPTPENETSSWRDTCEGDSGGPLQVTDETEYCMYSIVGLTSFGSPACGESSLPAIYTRVSYFVPWIENIVWPN